MALYYIVICDPSGSTAFFYIISQAALFLENVTEHKMYVLIVSTTFVWRISDSVKQPVRYHHKCM